MIQQSNIKSLLFTLSALLAAINIAGCKKFLEVKAPSTRVNQDNVYNTDATAIAVLTDIYTKMASGMDGGFTGQAGISVLSGLSADELTLVSDITNDRLTAYYRNQLRTGLDANFGVDYWGWSLNKIFTCNAAIEGLDASTSLTPAVKTQLIGEAKFIRALLNFYLVNFYGDVPLSLATNPNITRTLPRSNKLQVYEQIIVDLKEAQNLLSSSFLDASLLKSTPERVRPTKWAATALLARVYLYMEQYSNAEMEATEVIDNVTQFGLTDIDNVFLKNSKEAIWQLQPVNFGRNTEDAFTFVLPSTGPNWTNNPVYLSQQVLNAFEAGDARRQAGGWVNSVISGGNTYFFPSKYKATNASGAATEYLMVFRLAEQYLIRAEARTQQNNMDEAVNDLNLVRTRAELPGATANSQPTLLAAILRERQVELFTELGHRWLDLIRTGEVDQVMNQVTPLKANGAAWNSYQQLYPILFRDIQRNQNLTQNPGY